MSKWYKNKAETLVEEHVSDTKQRWWFENGSSGGCVGSSPLPPVSHRQEPVLEISEPEALCTIRDWGFDVGDRLDVGRKMTFNEIVTREENKHLNERIDALEDLLDDTIDELADLKEAYEPHKWLNDEDNDDVADKVYGQIYAKWAALDQELSHA